MQKLGLGCPLGFLASKPQANKLNILNLNYDCYVEIFSYLHALDDKLNLARAHPQFHEVLAREAPRRYAKINMRMLRCISDWDYLLSLCTDNVLECELRHGLWDTGITLPFLDALKAHCKNMRHLHLIFVHSDIKPPSDCGDLSILQMMQQKDLKSLSLTDAKAADVLQLKNFVELEQLHIDGIDVDLSDTDFVQIFQALPELRRLSMRFANRRQLPPLSDHCPMLEHLALDNFDTLTLVDLGDFPNLKSLRLIWRLSTNLNNNLFRILAQRYADRLEQLQITRVNPEQVAHIVALKRLQALACPLWPCEALMQLSQLKQLVCLVIQCSEAAVSMMQLLDIVANCTELKHLKLGNRWQMSELERFMCAVQDELRRQAGTGARRQLLLTLEFTTLPELQKQLRQKANPQLLQLDWLSSACRLCKPDRHTKHEVFQDLGLNLPRNALVQW